MKDLLIGIDAGTSVIKAVAFEATGRQIAMEAIPNRYETLQGGGVEQDLENTWSATAATLRKLAHRIPDLAARTAAIAVTGQGDGTWLIDGQGSPVGKGWLWLDARAADLVEELRGRAEDRLRFELTGTGLAACQQGSQLAWMKRNAPDMLARAATAFHCKDWLYFRLTGERTTDPSESTFTFGDFRTRRYSDEVIATLGLSDVRRLLPEPVDGARHSHPLSRAGAQTTGLQAGTPVVLGYVDVICTALGAGLFDEEADLGCTIIGSTGMHMRLVRRAEDVRLNPQATGYTMPIPIPGSYAQMQSNMAATLNIDWVLGLAREILCSQGLERSASDLIPSLDRWIAAAKPAAVLYQPYVSEAGERGPFVDSNARAGFIGISGRNSYGDLVRSVFESLGFAARDCYAAMGGIPSEIRLSGGAVRSQSLRRILAAALGAQVRANKREEAGAAGAAMIGAVSVGLYRSMADCAAEWVKPFLTAPEPPSPELAAIYDGVYPAYAQAHTALRPVWRTLSASRNNAK